MLYPVQDRHGHTRIRLLEGYQSGWGVGTYKLSLSGETETTGVIQPGEGQKKILLLSTATCWEGTEKREPDSCQRCTVRGWVATDTTWNIGNSKQVYAKAFYGISTLGANSALNWTTPGAACSTWACFEQDVVLLEIISRNLFPSKLLYESKNFIKLVSQ